ncbi:heterokaryon incompatibility protein-domain-containing protein [Pisolithus croceorrhizus]|nr:heterokaryon incompatibility protein-domain-containing protein [Pisolithus croceorrhizus]
MRLLDVSAVLDRERHIQRAGPKTKVLEQLDDETAKYAILSHRWGTEVDYDEITELMQMDEQDRDEVRQRNGYRKIIKSCEQAKEDGYRWLWIDTCCIDKRSSAELSEAINSMYRWYRNAQMCYVYLSDVDESALPTEQDFSRFGRSNGWPEWFSRGWTLQELIAPVELEFFNESWVSIGTKQGLISTLGDITGIPQDVLRDVKTLRSKDSPERPSVAQIMSWAADRKTTRVEDRAYSLMGLFDVNMPMLYGEGSKAFQRLQLEIIRVTSDYSIFAWNPEGQGSLYLRSVLADDPSCFQGCHDIENVHPIFFGKKLVADMLQDFPGKVIDRVKLFWLRRRVRPLQLSRWDVTNLGIQVSLPVIHCRGLPHFFTAVLPCCDRYGNLITIDLHSRGHSSYRNSHPAWLTTLHTLPEFKSLYFVHIQDAVKSCHNLRLHDMRASWHGFTHCGTFPREITDNTVTLSSQENTFIVLVYAHGDVGSRFGVCFGYYLGQVWSHIVCEECPAKQGTLSWVDFAKQVHDGLWSSPIDQFCFHNGSRVVRGAHLPQTIWDARVFCCSNNRSHSDVMIDIKQCPGCCTGPHDQVYMFESHAFWLPWTSNSQGSHELRLDGELTKFNLCSGQEISLGDYGNYSDHKFTCCGNIFEDMQKRGIDSTHLAYRPVASHVSSCKSVSRSRHMRIQNEVAVTSPVANTVTEQGGVEPAMKPLVLYQPRGLSLPDNEEFELLLEAFSTLLSGKDLVTTVIQCSEFNRVDHEERWMNVGDVVFGLRASASLFPYTRWRDD